MLLKAILWDLDGTIVDSEPLFAQAIARMNQKHNLQAPAQGLETGTCLQSSWQGLAIENIPQVTFQQWSDEIFEAVLTRFSTQALKENVKHVIEALHAQGLQQICVSNSMTPFIQAALQLTGVRSCFAGLVGRDSVTQGKPAPEIYLKAMADHGLRAHECIVVEDSTVGAQAAHAAGLRVIAVSTHDDGVIAIPDAAFVALDRKEILGIIAALTGAA